MREIKFRGKSLQTNDWVYGCLLQTKHDGTFIIEDAEATNFHGDGTELYATVFHSVHTDSVGQYIGIKDKNGREIYDGNRVKYQVIHYTDCSRKKIASIDEAMEGEIYYVDGITLGIKFVGGIDHVFWPTSVLDSSQNFEVIIEGEGDN